MNINDVIEDGNRYYKLEDGKSVKVVFENNFEKKVSDYDGKKTIKYECPCTISEGLDGEAGVVLAKTWSGSSKFYQDLMDMAINNQAIFEESIFRISRNGQGKDTRYSSTFEGIIDASL